MLPINYDFIIGLVCTLVGIYYLYKINAFNKRKYTPALGCITIGVGLIAWSTITLVSFSGIIEYPSWLYNKGWVGSWGYTSSRLFMASMWYLVLVDINLYSPKNRKQSKFDL